MSLLNWAKKEVELAKIIEAKDLKEGEFDYGGACYDSALKAFRSLTEDGHSGMSIKMTKQILNRLIDGSPLTPIEDREDIWNEITRNKKDKENERIVYQCSRMSSLFKYVYENGKVTYSDIDRFYCFDSIKPDMRYSFGLVKNIIDEMFPIIMPYSPANERIKVCCEQFLYSPDGGDFDSVGILYVDDPDNKRISVSRYFKEEDNKWVEIEFTEHINRFQAYLTREGRVKSYNIKSE